MSVHLIQRLLNIAETITSIVDQFQRNSMVQIEKLKFPHEDNLSKMPTNCLHKKIEVSQFNREISP